jgi:hypothetical protein
VPLRRRLASLRVGARPRSRREVAIPPHDDAASLNLDDDEEDEVEEED